MLGMTSARLLLSKHQHVILLTAHAVTFKQMMSTYNITPMQHELNLTTINSTDTANSAQDLADDTIIYPKRNQKELAWRDILTGLGKWRIWLMLSYQDVKLRYRRSILGPFWLTISMAITVYSMGFLYAHLFRMDMQNYYPFLVAGMLSWSLISTLILEYTDGLVAADGFIKQIKLPYTLYIHRIACRNLIIFFHNMLVMLPIILIFHETVKINYDTLLLLPGLAVIYLNALSYGLIFAMIGARYRDISQIIKSLVQVVFFVTPVMWGPTTLGEKHRYLIDLNPFYAYIELIRAPLLGKLPTLTNVAVVLLCTLLGVWMSLKLFTHYRSRIVYWL